MFREKGLFIYIDVKIGTNQPKLEVRWQEKELKRDCQYWTVSTYLHPLAPLLNGVLYDVITTSVAPSPN